MRGDPRFIEFFQAATPVNELGRMNIGSRPAKRKAAGSIDDLRAIPWIFAWTQTRFHLPVWLGIGDAFQVRAFPPSHRPVACPGNCHSSCTVPFAPVPGACPGNCLSSCSL